MKTYQHYVRYYFEPVNAEDIGGFVERPRFWASRGGYVKGRGRIVKITGARINTKGFRKN